MANPTPRGRGTGSPARRTLPAAARAAAKRAGRTERSDRAAGSAGARGSSGGDEAVRLPEPQRSGRTLIIEAPEYDWDDPPEPSPEFVAAVEAAESADEEPQEVAGRAGGAGVPVTRRRQRVLAALSAVLLVAGLVTAAVLGWQYREGRQAEQARAEALAAARKAAPVVLSYDYRHLDRDFARARAHLTGTFRDEYGRTTKTVVGPTAKKYRGVVKATVAAPAAGGVPAASVVSATPDKVVVLLFVNQVTESTQVSGSRLDLNRVRMTMTDTGGGWKVSAVDAL